MVVGASVELTSIPSDVQELAARSGLASCLQPLLTMS